MKLDEQAEFAILCTVMKFWPLEYLRRIMRDMGGREYAAAQREVLYREENHVRIR